MRRLKNDIKQILKDLGRWKYTRGRQKIDGRRLRYEAGTDICVATLQILREFEQDINSPYFMCLHDAALRKDVRNTILWAENIQRHAKDDEWPEWLRDVSSLLPYLWD